MSQGFTPGYRSPTRGSWSGALGVAEQVGLPAEVCVARLLDVEAFLERTEGGVKREANTIATGRLDPKQSNCSKAG